MDFVARRALAGSAACLGSADATNMLVIRVTSWPIWAAALQRWLLLVTAWRPIGNLYIAVIQY